MSMLQFQRALVELTLSGPAARAVRLGDDGVLDGYDLTDRERARLRRVAAQPGMSVQCSLARGNRFEPIAAAFPMTCVLLRPVLRELMDKLWVSRRPSHYQLIGEREAFAAFLLARIDDGTLDIVYLSEIFAYETLCLDLAGRAWRAPRCAAEGIARFCHDPGALLTPLSRLEQPPPDLPEGNFTARVSLRDGRYAIESVAQA